MSLHATGESFFTEELPVRIARFSQPIGVKEKNIARIEGDAPLTVGLLFTEPERHIEALKELDRPTVVLVMNCPGMPAIDETQPADPGIKAGMTESGEALEIHQLPGDLVMHRHHD